MHSICKILTCAVRSSASHRGAIPINQHSKSKLTLAAFFWTNLWKSSSTLKIIIKNYISLIILLKNLMFICALLPHQSKEREPWTVYATCIVALRYNKAILSVYSTFTLLVHLKLMGTFEYTSNCTMRIFKTIAKVNVAVIGFWLSRVTNTATIGS